MRELEERIRRDGIVEDGDVLKVDSFLNHQMDAALEGLIDLARQAGPQWWGRVSPWKRHSSPAGTASGPRGCGWSRWRGSKPWRRAGLSSAERRDSKKTGASRLRFS